ncbi:MAG: sensor histidine kinase KdpD [Sandaracinaceae bacterium]|nr:sensor histidine kinase KdpD [Sandaracinaceae bacterium]
MSKRDDDGRPDPDALLARVRAEERHATRAKLRLWLGASPGVGKTYTMLENAQRLRREGVDVVIGVVETHGRAETAALLEGLEELPRRRVPYRGRTLTELDLDAALARAPQVLLLDELAHTNVPGSRHAKRWQDAMELLDAGVEVHGTLNVQHVESLNDVIAQITHVRVRETVPDALVERADEIELIDVPPEVVLERLREGKVYVPDQAARAAEGFFRPGNLLALRELALRLTAEHVDAEMRAWRHQQGIAATWPARERIMVCVGPSPASARVVRAARRMAAVLRAPWMAAYVEKGSQSHFLSDRDRTRLAAHLMLAESLGAEVVGLAGERPAEALLALARDRNVSRIVIGKPAHARWRDLIYGSLLNDLIRGSGDIDVHVIAGDGAARDEAAVDPGGGPPRRAADGAPYLWGLLPVALSTIIGALSRDYLDLADVAMAYLVGISVTATFLGRGPSLAASVASVAAFDFFFVPPYFTFTVSDLRYVFTFAVMLCAGVLISSLTNRVREQSRAGRERERRTAALYALTRALAGARDAEAIARVAAEQLDEVFESPAVLLVGAPHGVTCPAPSALELSEADRTVARWALEHHRPAGRGLDTLAGARVIAMPLLAEGRARGALTIVPRPETRFDDPGQRHLLDAFVAQIALALERAQLADEAQRAALRAETEEIRSSLLSSVSHDLRTPIGTILGTSTALLDPSATLDVGERDELVGVIRDESTRLARLVSNLLDMTRVEAGTLEVKKEWIPLEEVVGSALARMAEELREREVEVVVARDAMAPMDPVLLEQVLVNLLGNAAKHTPAGTPIEVRAGTDSDRAWLEVADRGPGIAPGLEARIFDKFFRGDARTSGAGLGLAICRGIVVAHGGAIHAANRAGGGVTFRLTLPVEGAPPVVPTEPAGA